MDCWVAVATEAYARKLISEMPLFEEGGQYVPQTKELLTDIAERMWNAVKGVLEPFTGIAHQPRHLVSPFQAKSQEGY